MRSQIKKQFGKWCILSLLTTLVAAGLHSATCLPPAIGQISDTDGQATDVTEQIINPESELLTKQLEFVLKMNSIFLGFLGVSGGIAAYFFGKSFKEFQDFSKENIREVYKASEEKIERLHESSEAEVKRAIQSVREKAEREVFYLIDSEVREIVRTEVRNVQRVLQREQVISSTSVDYYLPGGMSNPTDIPGEVELLRAREFKNVEYFTELSELREGTSNVVVLDLIHYSTQSNIGFTDLNATERDDIAKPIVDDLLGLFPKSSVLIVYVNNYPRLSCVDSDKVPDGRYVLAANSSITVVGNSTDGAYVAKGAHKAAQSDSASQR